MALFNSFPLATTESLVTPSVSLRKLNTQILNRGLQLHERGPALECLERRRDAHSFLLQTAAWRDDGRWRCRAQRRGHNTIVLPSQVSYHTIGTIHRCSRTSPSATPSRTTPADMISTMNGYGSHYYDTRPTDVLRSLLRRPSIATPLCWCCS